MGEGFFDAFWGHGGHPEALYGFFAFGDFVDVSENEFSFAASVTSVDNF